jgi:mannonate dehydratase
MLEKTWRWFGANDNISLKEIRQIGIEGIVTALHHIPNGEIWSEEEITIVKKEIEQHNMRWSVVESLPVHEAIKYGGKERERLIENYKQSLINLAKCDVKIVCYNFMPVIDWIRTNLHYKLENGTEALFFDKLELVVFDCFILERKGAFQDYPDELVKQALSKYNQMDAHDKTRLIDSIIIKTQGFVDGISADSPEHALKLFKKMLAQYDGIDDKQLYSHLEYFLKAIIPVAEEYGIKMCIHPDDPPMKVLGLPRIVKCQEDIQRIFDGVDSPANGLTFCSGSLSAGANNRLNDMVNAFASRIFFVHLRSTRILDDGNFYEDDHLHGGADLYTIIKSLLIEQKRRAANSIDDQIPVRADHGHKLIHDFDHDYHPGYPLIGRLKGMAQIMGLEVGVFRSINDTEKE